MHPLLHLTCTDAARRADISVALHLAGLELTDTHDLATLHILDDAGGLLIRNSDEILLQLSASPAPHDIVSLARLGLELTTMWGLLRSSDHADAVGVIAGYVAHDARNALVPILFAAEALALDYPAARELTSMLVEGCDRVSSILQRITPSDTAGAIPPPYPSSVVDELVPTLRVVARRARLVTRLEDPLAPVALDRAELERALLTLVANAADTRRRSTRIVVATSSRAVTGTGARDAPAGDWVVIEVEDDGEPMDDASRDRALGPTFSVPGSPLPSGRGLTSIAHLARRAGGHIAIDNERRGARIALWLPPAVDAAAD